ncbi:hypothetical protein B7494_g8099 [Chlorociboria aeruginascens]|nr:hypothetical protein B7494_g8099 [Chlorociboria aeruginascens]
MSAAPKELESTLNKLSISSKPSKPASFKTRQPVAESWDDDLSSGEDTATETETDNSLSAQQSANYPSAPPPTPISPSTSFPDRDTFVSPYSYSSDGASNPRSERQARPEKTTAVASRLIAGALGVKTPKKTEEQRAYDRAVKEKEIKRINQEKEAAVRAKEEAERAKVAVWTD